MTAVEASALPWTRGSPAISSSSCSRRCSSSSSLCFGLSGKVMRPMKLTKCHDLRLINFLCSTPVCSWKSRHRESLRKGLISCYEAYESIHVSIHLPPKTSSGNRTNGERPRPGPPLPASLDFSFLKFLSFLAVFCVVVRQLRGFGFLRSPRRCRSLS